MPDFQQHFKNAAERLDICLGKHADLPKETGKDTFLEAYKQCYTFLKNKGSLPEKAPDAKDVERALNTLQQQVEEIGLAHSPQDFVRQAEQTIEKLGSVEEAAVSVGKEISFETSPPVPAAILNAASVIIGITPGFKELKGPLKGPIEETAKKQTKKIAYQFYKNPGLAANLLASNISSSAGTLIANAESVIRQAERARGKG